MTVDLRVIGIDPGPVPGFVLLRFNERPFSVAPGVIQCDHHSAPVVLTAVLRDLPPLTPTLVQIERFVVGRRAARSRTAGAGEVTRDLVARLRDIWEDHDGTQEGRLGGRWFQRSASNVKPWATDERLDAVGLLDATKGMKHARDAARHALFAAVHDGGIPDPLSRESRATR